MASSETHLDSTMLTGNIFWSSVSPELLYIINITIPADKKQRMPEHPNDLEALISIHKLN